jgi:hypothetical protein
MTHEVDVVVIGVGTAGEDLALQLLDAGLEVAGSSPNWSAVNAPTGPASPPRWRSEPPTSSPRPVVSTG